MHDVFRYLQQMTRPPLQPDAGISPKDVMRKLDDLLAFHGSQELPSIDNLLCYRFTPGHYQFYSGRKRASMSGRQRQLAQTRETA